MKHRGVKGSPVIDLVKCITSRKGVPSFVHIEGYHCTLEKSGQYRQEGLDGFVIVCILVVNDGRKSFGWLPFPNLKRMVLKINKSDYDRMVCALEVARDSETNANKKRLYNLTRKKLNRQNEVFLKKNKDRRRSV